MDLNLLLAREKISLLRARFASTVDVRDRYFLAAGELANSLSLSTYPHRPFAAELLA